MTFEVFLGLVEKSGLVVSKESDTCIITNVIYKSAGQTGSDNDEKKNADTGYCSSIGSS